MKIGWIYPHRERCGIARYAHDYADALRPHVELVDIDPLWWVGNRSMFAEKANDCSIIHVHYDTAAYMRGHREFFGAMARSPKAPLVVSLHEVYKEDPAVYPRSRIAGRFPLLHIKRMMWDMRHPVQCTFNRHCAASFHADSILVHHRYHADIIAGKGCALPGVRVEPLPIKLYGQVREFTFHQRSVLRLGAFGFINPLFDYDLLFAALKLLPRPWTFTWIGGIRTPGQQTLLDEFQERIIRENWTDRFYITGWVPETELPDRLAGIDIVCALFRERSSSASLAHTIGAGKAVIATSLPLTREIATGNEAADAPPPMLLTKNDAAGVVAAIEHLCTDATLRRELCRGIQTYCETTSFEAMALRLYTLYRELLAA